MPFKFVKILSALILFSHSCYSQFFGISTSYAPDISVSGTPYSGHGGKIAIGAERITLDEAPIVLSFRVGFALTHAGRDKVLDSLEFYVPPDIELSNNLGYVDMASYKTSIFQESEIALESSNGIDPFLHLQFQVSDYYSSVFYNLYEESECMCRDDSPVQEYHTTTLGGGIGAGLNWWVMESFGFHVRGVYSFGWSMFDKGKSHHIVDPNSFYVPRDGELYSTAMDGNFVEQFSLQAGITFKFPNPGFSWDEDNSDGWNDDSESWNDESDDDEWNATWDDEEDDSWSDDDSGDDNSNYTPSSSGDKKDCTPVRILPKAKKSED